VNIKLTYFKLKEFDQPGIPGSHIHMDLNLLILIDKIRHRAGIPFRITSAYRSPEYNATLKNASNTSAHCLGKAVDISATDSNSRYKIIEAAVHFGIQRIGISPKFIHLDIKEKPARVAWLYN
jgi:zinc D-Ala-D-Ala carboxypeptidase